MEESMNEPLPVGSCVVLDGLDLRIAERPTMATVLSWISTKCQLVARFGNNIPGFQVNTPYAFEIGLINSGSASRYQVLLQGENECKNAAAPHPCKLMNRVDCTACHASAPPRLNEGAISPARWAIAWRRNVGENGKSEACHALRAATSSSSLPSAAGVERRAAKTKRTTATGVAAGD